MQRADNPVLEQLRSMLREQMDSAADHIAGGGCQDFAEYRHAVGLIEGFARAERDLLDLDKRLNEQ